MTEKLYVVIETLFTYDDEVYRVPKAGAGTPTLAFRSRLNAEAEALRRTVDAMREYNLDEFGFKLSDLFSDTEKAKSLLLEAGFSAEPWEFSRGLRKAPPELLASLGSCLIAPMFQVAEVEQSS